VSFISYGLRGLPNPMDVTILVQDDTVTPAAIEGVVVNVYDGITKAYVAQATTDATGLASFVLTGEPDPGKTYEVRLFKVGALFANPFTIAVFDSGTNDFEVAGTLLDLEVATDPNLCRCTGRFMGFDLQPRANKLVRFSAEVENKTVQIVNGDIVAASDHEVRTDDNGYVKVDLVRGAVYWLIFAGDEDNSWKVTIPNRASVNLIELIHPAPGSLDWDDTDAPGDAVSLAVGESKDVSMTLTLTSYETDEYVGNWLDFDNDDTDVVSASVQKNVLTLSGLTAGTANITVTARTDLKPGRAGGFSVSSTPLVVTVT